MDSRNYVMEDSVPDWNDISMFNGTQFDDTADSPFGTSTAFHDFTTLDAYGESPIGLTMRTPSKAGSDNMTAAAAAATMTATQNQHNSHMITSNSAETSSQDSSSDTSSRRKRKNASESPVSDPSSEGATIRPGQIKQEADAKPGMSAMQKMGSYGNNNFMRSTPSLSLEHNMRQAHNSMAKFDINSAASSPIGQGDFNSAMSLDSKMNIPTTSVAHFQQQQESPVQTINPGMFAISSRDQSPSGNGMIFNPSPNAVFSSPTSNSPDAFNNPAGWNSSLQTPNWSNDFGNQLASPGGMTLTPSPAANSATPSAQARGNFSHINRSPLHIAPISTKSRVETQINIVMTLEQPPLGVEQLHLPLHTIAKSKLLAKEEYDSSKVLELHTMLVCTSAMHKAPFKEKALQRAAMQNNAEIQRRAELSRELGEEEKNDVKNVDEADKPANGGEVKICNNCIQRERKRAGRKKTKREEEQLHWERFETERVVVFNSNELLPFKSCEPGQYPVREPETGDAEPYTPPDGALHVTAAMRIACYCRHQGEKEGFQVIFTLKDQQGNVVAQQMSDSILITDDHKTHPQNYPTAATGDGYYSNNSYMGGLAMSHSMVDMTAHVPAFTSSRSAGNLQALAYPQQFNAHSHVHQLPGGSGYTSQATSATMTPTSLSRPGSPSSAGHSGPNKKRKSATFHRRVPSNLTMTPRVDTNQPPSNNVPSAISMNSQFSPTTSAFPGQMNQSFMTVPSAQMFGSGPPTPNDSGPFAFNQSQSDMSRMSNNQAYFSHPSSAVPSRASSPVLQQGRGNMAAYARQQPVQTPTNSLNARSAMFAVATGSGSAGNGTGQTRLPSISKLTPSEGSAQGGTEVAIFGDNFVMGVQVAFGEAVAPKTVFVSSTALSVITPPGRPGPVSVSLVPPPGSSPYPPGLIEGRYTYTQHNEEMMVMALKFLTQQQFGNPGNWENFARQSASSFLQSNVGRAGLSQGYPAGHRMAAESAVVEELILQMFEAVDMSERQDQACYDMPSDNNTTMLSLASALGMHRIVAALLARGANADVRDKGGYTPLMHAALHEHSKIFQLLLARGADPTVRSLTGIKAIDLVSLELRDDFVQFVSNTARRRNSRPTLRPRSSYDSTMSSKASWDISSASFYESDLDSSEKPLDSSVASRRQSVHAPTAEGIDNGNMFNSAVPCQQAWRAALAAHVAHIQDQIYGKIPRIQTSTYQYLRALLQDKISHQPQSIAKELSDRDELLSATKQAKLRDVFAAMSSAPTPSLPPPAYHELFPNDQCAIGGTVTKRFTFTEEKFAFMYDEPPRSAFPDGSPEASAALPITWFWISMFVISTSIFMHVMMPYITGMMATTMALAQSVIIPPV